MGASQNNNLGRINLNVDIKYSEFERQMFFLDLLEILVSTKLGGGDFGLKFYGYERYCCACEAQCNINVGQYILFIKP